MKRWDFDRSKGDPDPPHKDDSMSLSIERLHAKVSTTTALIDASTTAHLASLDGVRGIAILGVMLVHVGFPGLELAWLGVDLFFVLSGFLITTLLIGEARRTGGVALGKFWGRRFLRLMPAYGMLAGFVTAAIYWTHWGWTREVRGWDAVDFIRSIWLYYANYAPMKGIWEHQHLTGLLWSLAVEEQFYLIWPILFSLAWSRPGWAEGLAWTLVLAILVTCFLVEPRLLHFRIYTRGLGIMLGCSLALTSARSSGLSRRLGSPQTRLAIVAVGLLSYAAPAVLLALGRIDDTQMHLFFSPIFCASMALLVAMLWYGPRDRLAASLSWGPLAYLGKISYGLYLYHMVAFYLVWNILLVDLGHWPTIARYGLRVSAFLGLSVAIATLSHYAVERPFLKLKSRLR
jgi:peptidoglycan/LPS O-acetylase OafA/YrhL